MDTNSDTIASNEEQIHNESLEGEKVAEDADNANEEENIEQEENENEKEEHREEPDEIEHGHDERSIRSDEGVADDGDEEQSNRTPQDVSELMQNEAEDGDEEPSHRTPQDVSELMQNEADDGDEEQSNRNAQDVSELMQNEAEDGDEEQSNRNAQDVSELMQNEADDGDEEPSHRIVADKSNANEEENIEREENENEKEEHREELDEIGHEEPSIRSDEREAEDGDEGPSHRTAQDVSELMQNIFGDDDVSDDDDDDTAKQAKPPQLDSDEDEPKLLRIEHDDDAEEDNNGRKWDFDIMLAKKKSERRKRRRKDGSIDLMADADDQIRELVEEMNEAANEDRQSNIDRRPAIKKRMMLSAVKNALLKADLFEAMLDNGMISALSEWLAPLPDKSLPALEIRCLLLKTLESWPNLEQGILKQSGLGRAVMYLFKHPKETKENKLIAARLIREWSRPIFQLDSDFHSLSKEERVQRDFSQMPLAKRRRLSMEDEGGIFSAARQQQKQQKDDEGKHPGEPGFIPRARVPKPSTKDYVIRPKPEIEGQFRGSTKGKQATRLSKAQREFRERNKAAVTKRAIGVSIAGKNL